MTTADGDGLQLNLFVSRSASRLSSTDSFSLQDSLAPLQTSVEPRSPGKGPDKLAAQGSLEAPGKKDGAKLKFGVSFSNTDQAGTRGADGKRMTTGASAATGTFAPADHPSVNLNKPQNTPPGQRSIIKKKKVPIRATDSEDSWDCNVEVKPMTHTESKDSDWDAKVAGVVLSDDELSDSSIISFPLQEPEGPEPFGYLARKYADSSGRGGCVDSILEADAKQKPSCLMNDPGDKGVPNRRSLENSGSVKEDTIGKSPSFNKKTKKSVIFRQEVSQQLATALEASSVKDDEKQAEPVPAAVSIDHSPRAELHHEGETTASPVASPEGACASAKKPKSKCKAKGKAKPKGGKRGTTVKKKKEAGSRSGSEGSHHEDHHDDHHWDHHEDNSSLPPSVQELSGASVSNKAQNINRSSVMSVHVKDDGSEEVRQQFFSRQDTDPQFADGYLMRKVLRKRSVKNFNDRARSSVPAVDTQTYFSDNLPLEFYKGELVGGKRHGYGRQSWEIGDEYCGQWADGKAHGLGKFIYDDGCSYIGEWKQGRAHGSGVLSVKWPEECTWTGNFDNDNLVGDGTETWGDGSTYAGQFAAGMKDGYGVFEWPDGKEYRGTWKDNQRNGDGRLTNALGQIVFEGQWKSGLIEGTGLYKWEGGWSYKGQYVLEMKEGFGIFEWPDGARYEGYWKDGLKNGRHIYFPGTGDSNDGLRRRSTPVIFEPKGRRNFNMKENSAAGGSPIPRCASSAVKSTTRNKEPSSVGVSSPLRITKAGGAGGGGPRSTFITIFIFSVKAWEPAATIALESPSTPLTSTMWSPAFTICVEQHCWRFH
eukprot:gnl/MRDRNA2_/MRDRNA2_108237_c0_seq1.p1 gnl/MRDRNA2_/MRDRNA2_108237_c0~~gnl/MRDRNA2_/MRDRNA2_108237_c0_seq1.p1  ORF type:complete len:819 (-),score=137.90 gnl/MRDRNA2_/MRDRNA2_108237_c0_seq1:757-3213(-)